MNIVSVEWLALHFWKALGSDLGLDALVRVSWVLSVLPGSFRNSTSYRVTTAFFDIVSNSLFTHRTYASDSKICGRHNRSTLCHYNLERYRDAGRWQAGCCAVYQYGRVRLREGASGRGLRIGAPCHQRNFSANNQNRYMWNPWTRPVCHATYHKWG